jgi:hypothetical protein
MYLIERLQKILLSPKEEWPVIKAEAISIPQIYAKYLLILAALPSVGYLLSFLATGSFIAALRLAIISYVVWLATFDLSAVIVDRLAPIFSSVRNVNFAFKLVAFSVSPLLLVGVLMFIPTLGVILWVIGAAYSAYLCYYGLPVMMQAPEDRVIPYTVTVVVVVLVIYFVLVVVLGLVFGASLRQFFSL